MTKAQHTPSPWHVRPATFSVPKTHIFNSDRSFAIAHIFGDTKKQEIANSRLIAAAPDSNAANIKALHALRDIIGAADNNLPYTAQELAQLFIPICDELEAVIAKTKGE